MPKRSMRRDLLAQRQALSPAEWQTASRAAQQRLLEQPLFRQAISIALYAPIRNEVDTTLLFDAARAAGKSVQYPLVCGDRLTFHEIATREQLAAGSFGIPEPCPVGDVSGAPLADLLVVPGVAFDLRGHRIGFGKGYYDRYLAGLQRLPLLVGFCHDFQLIEAVPSEGHDIRMDCVVTDRRVVTVVTGRLARPDDHISGGS